MALHDQVEKYAAKSYETMRRLHGSDQVTPKTVEIMATSCFGEEIGFSKGEYTFSGRYIPFMTSHEHIGKRTVFDPSPVLIGGKPFYLEFKGLGRDGREMYLNYHTKNTQFPEPNFGMWLEESAASYNIYGFASKQGLRMPLPIAGGRISGDEYFRQGLEGLKMDLGAILYSSFGFLTLKSLSVGFDPREVAAIAKKAMPSLKEEFKKFKALSKEEKDFFLKNHPKGIDDLDERIKSFEEFQAGPEYKKREHAREEQMKKICDIYASHLSGVYFDGSDDDFIKEANRLGIGSLVDAFATKQEVGFVIRACRSPFRLSEAHPYVNYDLANSRNRKIAKRVGKTFAALASRGRFHTYPFPFNWTTAGELTDGEDHYLYTPENFEECSDGLAADLKKFLFPEINKYHLLPEFTEGCFGEPMPPAKAARRMHKMIRDGVIAQSKN